MPSFCQIGERRINAGRTIAAGKARFHLIFRQFLRNLSGELAQWFCPGFDQGGCRVIAEFIPKSEWCGTLVEVGLRIWGAIVWARS